MINRVREVRKRKGMPQVELAGKVKQSLLNISLLENEKFIPDERLKKKIARALSCKVSELFPG